jgi:mRNA interferase RelE/StbE
MPYSIFFEKRVQKFILKLNKDVALRIINKITKLKDNPIPSDSKRIVNIKGKCFRLRVGIYRILYRIDNENNSIVVFKINTRERVYDK